MPVSPYRVSKKAPWTISVGEDVLHTCSTRGEARELAQKWTAEGRGLPSVVSGALVEGPVVPTPDATEALETVAPTIIESTPDPTPDPTTTKESTDMRVQFQMPGKVYLVLKNEDPTITVALKLSAPQLALLAKGVVTHRPKGLVAKFDLTEKQAEAVAVLIDEAIVTIRETKNAGTKGFHKQNTMRYMATTVDRISEAIDEARNAANAA